MVKRELEWIFFVLFASGIATLVAFRGASRSFIDFSIEGSAMELTATGLFFSAVVLLTVANILFAVMVRLARRDIGKTQFLKRLFGITSLVAGGACVAMGTRALSVFGTQGYEELAYGSTAAVIVLLALVLMAMFRTRELPGTNNEQP